MGRLDTKVVRLVAGVLSVCASAAAQPTGALPDASPTANPSAAPPASPPPPALTAATPAPAPPLAPQQANPVSVGTASWSERYQHARERLLAGDFQSAEQELSDLAQVAPGPIERSLAVELAHLARTWRSRGLVFVRNKDLGDASIKARAVDERSTDEIAVLYLNSVVYGLGTGGWLAVQTEPDSAAGYILPSLALGGASAGAVAILDSGRPLRYGVPQSIVSGMYVGLSEGLVWTFWNQSRTDRQDEWSGKTVATLIWGSATAGAIVGGAIGSTSGTTPGRASFIGSAALWGGLVAGMGVAALHEENYAQDDAALLGAGIGMNAGVVGALLAAGPVSPSIARVRFLDLGGIAGGLVFGGLYISAAGDGSDARAALGLTSLGIASGLGTAWFLTESLEPDRGADSASSNRSGEIATAIAPTRGGFVLRMSGWL
ncbi:MAG: hypothetical protein IPI67_05945 [Myxococcales bacterium]|nr:hypothetical protein [Myxococcales bacterium]